MPEQINLARDLHINSRQTEAQSMRKERMKKQDTPPRQQQTTGIPRRSKWLVRNLVFVPLLISLWVPTLSGYDPHPDDLAEAQIPNIRGQVSMALQGLDLWSPGAEELVFNTGYVESHYIFREGINGGPELGYWQIHPNTAEYILFDYLQRPSKENLKNNLAELLGYDPDSLRARPDLLRAELRDNDILGAALCRLWYRAAKWNIPSPGNLWGQAWLWKLWYNTEKGTGTNDRFYLMIKALNS
ncbi:hypothetical protein ACFLZR_01600 [Candidatus Neomarinimicrobiota bacterium]